MNDKSNGHGLWFKSLALQYLELRDLVNSNTKPRKQAGEQIKEYIHDHGEADAEGNLVVEFDSPKMINGATYTGLMLRKEAVPTYNEEAAMELVEERGLLASIPCETIIVYDWEDGLHVLNAQKKITDEELDGVMSEEVSWSLQVVK